MNITTAFTPGLLKGTGGVKQATRCAHQGKEEKVGEAGGGGGVGGGHQPVVCSGKLGRAGQSRKREEDLPRKSNEVR